MVHIGGQADTPTVPAAPSLTMRTCSVCYWTPTTEREKDLKIDTGDLTPQAVLFLENHTSINYTVIYQFHIHQIHK